jgi:hypothetical protein
MKSKKNETNLWLTKLPSESLKPSLNKKLDNGKMTKIESSKKRMTKSGNFKI